MSNDNEVLDPGLAPLPDDARAFPVDVRKLVAAACGLDRGGKRGPGSHVSITVESWDRLVLARRVYAMGARARAEATAGHADGSPRPGTGGGAALDASGFFDPDPS
jgi:hypothetical protein